MYRSLRQSILAVLVLPFLVGAATAAEEWVVRESSRSVAETVERLTTAIERAGAKVVAVVDHSQNAESAGAEIEPTTVVIFGNPRLGTPAIQSNRRLALDLPLRILVWEENGVTRLGYLTGAALARRYDLEPGDRNLARMEEAMGSLSAAALLRGDSAENR